MRRILIVGTGGVGGYFGGRLAKVGNEVTFIARGQHLEAIKTNGLQVKSILGDFTIFPASATDQIENIMSPDLVLLCIKTWQVKEFAEKLKPVLHENSVVIPLQNGVMTPDELCSILNPSQVMGGSCRIFSKIIAPGSIHHYGIDPMIIFGELDHSLSERTEKIKQLFNDAGILAKIAEDIHTELWKKFMIIASGGLLAVTRSPYGALRELKETRELMMGLLEEIFQVSKKAGAKLDANIVEQTMAYIDTYPYDSSTSMARDIWEGKPSEIEYQNGSIVKLGHQYGIDTPINRYIYHFLLPQEKKARNFNL